GARRIEHVEMIEVVIADGEEVRGQMLAMFGGESVGQSGAAGDDGADAIVAEESHQTGDARAAGKPSCVDARSIEGEALLHVVHHRGGGSDLLAPRTVLRIVGADDDVSVFLCRLAKQLY